jgi:hypothetical protein
MTGNQPIYNDTILIPAQTIMLANGDQMPITYMGNMSLSLGSNSYRLNNVQIIFGSPTFLQSFSFLLLGLLPLLCDNLGTRYMTSNLVIHTRTKHIEPDYHYIRQYLISGSHRVQFVSSSDQLVDLHKGSLYETVSTSQVKSCISPGLSDLRGSIEPSLYEFFNSSIF